MAYLVKVSVRAQRDLVQIYERVKANDSDAAVKWYTGLKRAILSLESQPARCPLTPENEELRHLLYGNRPHVYRTIFRLREKQKVVDVLHIRHGARSGFQISDIE